MTNKLIELLFAIYTIVGFVIAVAGIFIAFTWPLWLVLALIL